MDEKSWKVTERVPPLGLERVLNECAAQGLEPYAIIPHPQYDTVTVVTRRNPDGEMASLFTAEDSNALLVNILRNWKPEKWARLARSIDERLPEELRPTAAAADLRAAALYAANVMTAFMNTNHHSAGMEQAVAGLRAALDGGEEGG